MGAALRQSQPPPSGPPLKLVRPPTEAAQTGAQQLESPRHPDQKQWVEARFAASRPIDTHELGRDTYDFSREQWRAVLPATDLPTARDFQDLLSGAAIVMLKGPAAIQPGTIIALDSTRACEGGSYVGTRFASVKKEIRVAEGRMQPLLLGSDGELHILAPRVPDEISRGLPKDAAKKFIIPHLTAA